MANTDIAICSLALMELGAKPINSFEDPGDVAKMLRLAYPVIRAGIIGAYQWECFRVRKALTRLAERPLGFAYAFLKPGDMLGAPVAIYDSDAVAARAVGYFEVRGPHIVGQMEQAWAEYTAMRPEAEWPSWMVDLMVGAVGARIAFMVTDSQSTQDAWEAKTYGTPSENRLGGLMGQAMTLDAQGSGNNPGLYDNAFIDARFGGVYPGEGR